MRRLNGYVFDLYDDVDGRVLKAVAPTPDDLPDYVKTASRHSEDDIERIPDDRFALVMLDEGRKLKKYAMTDKGNTALSVLYLLKQAHLLPQEAVKVAAGNLIAACEHYGIDVPGSLKLAAKSGRSPVSGKSQKPYAKDAKVIKVAFPPTEQPLESLENPELGKHDAANADVQQRTNMGGTPGTNFLEVPLFSQKEKVKTAGAFGDSPGEVRTKQQSWRQSPYVDMSGWDPRAAEVPEAPKAELTILEGKYPIEGYDQVKTASAYFEENWREFGPAKRHEYCVKLASRMEELGMEVPTDVARYGSETYAADVDSFVEARRSWVHDEYKPSLDLLLEKRAHVAPDTFAQALEEFDKLSGLRWHWDAQIADPYYSTFGPSLEKIAEDNWRYDEDGTRISKDDLKNLAMNGRERVAKSFGEDFAKEFQKKPKSVFESLPAPNKKVLARLASDRHAGTYTE